MVLLLNFGKIKGCLHGLYTEWRILGGKREGYRPDPGLGAFTNLMAKVFSFYQMTSVQMIIDCIVFA